MANKKVAFCFFYKYQETRVIQLDADRFHEKETSVR